MFHRVFLCYTDPLSYLHHSCPCVTFSFLRSSVSFALCFSSFFLLSHQCSIVFPFASLWIRCVTFSFILSILSSPVSWCYCFCFCFPLVRLFPLPCSVCCLVLPPLSPVCVLRVLSFASRVARVSLLSLSASFVTFTLLVRLKGYAPPFWLSGCHFSRVIFDVSFVFNC